MSDHKKGTLLAILGALMWGIQGPISQFLFQSQHVSTEWLMGVKMTIAGILILTFTTIKWGVREVLGPFQSLKDTIQLIAYTLFGITLVQYMYFLTIKVSDAGIATILQSLGTIIIIILTIIVYHKWPSPKEWLAVIVAIVGTYLLVMKAGFTLSISKQAVCFGLLLALAGALQTMIPVSLLQCYRSFTLLGWAMLTGGLIFSCIHPIWHQPPHLTVPVLCGLLFIIFFGTSLSYICFTTSLNYISATRAGLLGAFEPASATLGAFLCLGTTFTVTQLLGGALVLSTVFILALPTKKA